MCVCVRVYRCTECGVCFFGSLCVVCVWCVLLGTGVCVCGVCGLFVVVLRVCVCGVCV